MNKIDENLLPKSLEAEQSVLGAMLIDKEAVVKVMPLLNPDSFYKPEHSIIYKAIMSLYELNKEIDIITVYDEVKKTKKSNLNSIASYLSSLANNVASSALVETHAKIVQEKYLLRLLLKNISDVTGLIYSQEKDFDEIISEAEKRVFEISLKNQIKKEISISESVVSVISDLEEIALGKEIGIIRTGLNDLDSIIGGLKNSELSILGARPSMGKSSLALKIMRNVSERIPVLIFSLEMSHKSITTKLLSMESGMSYFKISTCKMNQAEKANLSKSALTLNKLKIFIDDTPSISIFEIKSKSKRLKLKENIGLIIVDYLQLIKSKADTREREIAIISQELKSLAKELDIPVLCLSQLNRSLEQRSDKRPNLSDLRESGSIEQDADMVFFLYRDEYYGIETDENGNSTKGVTELCVAKNRNGATGMIKLLFKHDTTDFVSYIEKNQIESYYEDII